MRDPEYDRFGPWIYEISDEDPLPPIFIPYVSRTDEAILSIKIPRRIDRRDAKPGWHLYDYVVNLYENDFQIWKRVGNNVETVCFQYKEITCLQDREVLLSGELSITAADYSYSFEYSTVSSDIIKKAVTIIRRKYISGSKTVQINLPVLDCDSMLDFYFKNLVLQEKKESPENILLFFQSRIKLQSIENRFLKKIFYGISAKEILESLHFCDGRELKIIRRDKPFKNIVQPVYGKEDIFIPVDHIHTIRADAQPDNVLTKFTIETSGGSIDCYSTMENSALNEYLDILRQISS